VVGLLDAEQLLLQDSRKWARSNKGKGKKNRKANKKGTVVSGLPAAEPGHGWASSHNSVP
jgi:hypothetical protein